MDELYASFKKLSQHYQKISSFRSSQLFKRAAVSERLHNEIEVVNLSYTFFNEEHPFEITNSAEVQNIAKEIQTSFPSLKVHFSWYTIAREQKSEEEVKTNRILLVGFDLPEERRDTLVDDWYVAVPYVSSQAGFRLARMHQAIDYSNARFPFINWAIWESLEEWHAATSTPESIRVHAHQGHVRRSITYQELVEEITS